MTAETSTQHQLLLDALEQAGFPRSTLVGTGNAFRIEQGTVILNIYPKKDAQGVDSMCIHVVHSSGIELGLSLTKVGARKVGAFLLAWGFTP